MASPLKSHQSRLHCGRGRPDRANRRGLDARRRLKSGIEVFVRICKIDPFPIRSQGLYKQHGQVNYLLLLEDG